MAHPETSECSAFFSNGRCYSFVRDRDGDEDGADFAFVENVLRVRYEWIGFQVRGSV